MWNKVANNKNASITTKAGREKKVIDMRAWLQQKREAARNVLVFTPRGWSPNDQPPSVA
jgi:hypothetical protein